MNIFQPLKEILSKLDEILCYFQTKAVVGLTVGAPVNAPVGSDPTVLFDPATQTTYYWDGADWQAGTAPGATDNSISFPVASQPITTRYTIHSNDNGNLTYTLPFISPPADGTLFTVKNADDTDVITVDTDNAGPGCAIFSPSVPCVASVTLNPGESLTFLYALGAYYTI